MAVLKSKEGADIYIDCSCGCDQGIRFRIDKVDAGHYCFMSYTSGDFYREQEGGFRAKLRRIWAIIRNRDYYYSDIVMTKDEFDEFCGYISRFRGVVND